MTQQLTITCYRVDSDINSEVGVALSKEIKRSEESLHNRLGRLITKELDKQRKCLILVRS